MSTSLENIEKFRKSTQCLSDTYNKIKNLISAKKSNFAENMPGNFDIFKTDSDFFINLNLLEWFFKNPPEKRAGKPLFYEEAIFADQWVELTRYITENNIAVSHMITYESNGYISIEEVAFIMMHIVKIFDEVRETFKRNGDDRMIEQAIEARIQSNDNEIEKINFNKMLDEKDKKIDYYLTHRKIKDFRETLNKITQMQDHHKKENLEKLGLELFVPNNTISYWLSFINWAEKNKNIQDSTLFLTRQEIEFNFLFEKHIEFFDRLKNQENDSLENEEIVIRCGDEVVLTIGDLRSITHAYLLLKIFLDETMSAGKISNLLDTDLKEHLKHG